MNAGRPETEILALMGDGRERTANDIATRLHLDPADVGKIMRPLTAAGFVVASQIPIGTGPYVRVWRKAP